MPRKVKITSGILLFLYLAAVVVLCIIQTESLPQVEPTWFGIPTDKIVHFLMFMPYPVLTWLLLHKEGTTLARQVGKGAVILLTGMAVAAATELVQGMTEYRSGDILDFAADCTGMFTGIIIAAAASYAVRKNRR